MVYEWILNDRIIKRIINVIEKLTGSLQIEVISVVLYGSKARGDRNSQNDYDLMVLVNNDLELKRYIQFNSILRLELLKEKLHNAKILVYTPDTFEEILYNDKIAGTFLYMICKENIIFFDKHNTFKSIKDRISHSTVKSEEEFLQNCIEFAKSLGSEKWAQKWEKSLMQFNYLRKRREY